MFRFSRIVVLWMALVFLTACSSPEATEDDIVGLWVERHAAGAAGDIVDCAVFEFRANGTFVADNFPREYFMPDTAPDLPRVQALGTWTIEKLGDTQFVDIFIEPNLEWLYSAARHSTLYISNEGAGRTLYAWAYDPEDRLYLVRQDSSDCPN